MTAGGKERYDSVYAGLLCCQDTDYVYIHDGARPFITEEMVQRGYEAVKRKQCLCNGHALQGHCETGRLGQAMLKRLQIVKLYGIFRLLRYFLMI